MSNHPLEPVDPIAMVVERDDRYRYDAYLFMFEALRFAQERLDMGQAYVPPAPSELDEGAEDSFQEVDFAGNPFEEDDEDQVERHVTGQDLCEAIRQYALEQFGLAAQTVLNHWGIYRTNDFGNIVFNLIDVGTMRKTEHDRLEDFDDVYEFDGALRGAFKITMPNPSEGRWA